MRTTQAYVVLNALNEGLIRMPFCSVIAAAAFTLSLMRQGYLVDLEIVRQ